jgi:pyruvate ferredoxin oxidoreductase alpha subunit
MSLVNRALSGPINIHCDHADVMGMRDSGWIILLSENGQEAYDNLLQAVRIGEHPDVLLPVTVCQDGFITSHGTERVEIYEDNAVKAFVGDYQPQWPLLDLENPKTYGAAGFHDYYYESKRQQMVAMENARAVILDVARSFNQTFDRDYGLFETYRLADAEVAIVIANSTAGTTKVVVDQLREDGVKAGLLKPRVFRPFPAREMAEALGTVQAVAVMDRSSSFGAMGNAGPLFLETVAALAVHGFKVPVAGYVYGLGGRDILPHEIEAVYYELLGAAETGQVVRKVQYLGVRE